MTWLSPDVGYWIKVLEARQASSSDHELRVPGVCCRGSGGKEERLSKGGGQMRTPGAGWRPGRGALPKLAAR